MSDKYGVQRMVVGADTLAERRRMFCNCRNQRRRHEIVAVKLRQELIELDVVDTTAVSDKYVKSEERYSRLLQRQFREVRHGRANCALAWGYDSWAREVVRRFCCVESAVSGQTYGRCL